MTFFNRVRFYIFGILIGVFVSYLFFGNRSCNQWMPGKRVKAAIMEFEFLSSEKIDCKMGKQSLTPETIAQFVPESSVVFKESITDKKPRIYVLRKEEKTLRFAVDFEQETVHVFFPENENKGCENEKNALYKRSKPLKTLDF